MSTRTAEIALAAVGVGLLIKAVRGVGEGHAIMALPPPGQAPPLSVEQQSAALRKKHRETILFTVGSLAFLGLSTYLYTERVDR